MEMAKEYLGEGPKAAGRRLRLFRCYILRIETIAELAAKIGIRENQMGNWERGSPFHRYYGRLAGLRPGLSVAWFYSGEFRGTSFDVVQELLAAQAEAESA